MREFTCSNYGKTINYMHLISGRGVDQRFHFHDMYEIYFFISGSVKYFIERKIYLLEQGDLIILNNREIHKPSLQPSDIYERIIIFFDPSILSPFYFPDFNLMDCFNNRQKGEDNRIHLDMDQTDELMKLFAKFETLEDSTTDVSTGSNILMFAYFLELLVFINNVYSTKKNIEKILKVPKKLIPILDYIDSNIKEDLTLNSLASRFFIDKFHLSRSFKNVTGINIHDYILFKRISLSKKLLADSHNILDACQMSGFQNYTTFIRTFKRITGLLPKEYQKQQTLSSSLLE